MRLNSITIGLLFLIAASTARGQTLNEAQATALEKQFEQALVAGDEETIGKLMADSATVVYAGFANGPKWPQLFSSTHVWSKKDFMWMMGPGFRWLESGKIKIWSFDESARKITLSEDGLVVTTRAVEFLWEGYFCAGFCWTTGAMVDVYATTVWSKSSGGPRVILFQTSPAESNLSTLPLVTVGVSSVTGEQILGRIPPIAVH